MVGCWAWAMLVCRPAFAILDACYRWIGRFEGEDAEEPQRLPVDVLDELKALGALAIFFEANLELDWHTTVYMTDASDEGFGAVATKSSVEEIRDELDRGAEQVWQIRVGEVHKEIEDEVSKEGLEEDELMHPREGRPGILLLQQGLLDLKGEVGHLVSAWSEDVRMDELLDVMVVERLFSRLRRRWYWICHLTMFLDTFADDYYRDSSSPWGRPGLGSEMQHKVDQDNYIAQVIIEIARLAVREGLGFVVVGPAALGMLEWAPWDRVAASEGVFTRVAEGILVLTNLAKLAEEVGLWDNFALVSGVAVSYGDKFGDLYAVKLEELDYDWG